MFLHQYNNQYKIKGGVIMLVFDESTGTYFDTEKVDAIIAFFLALYAPADWRERLNLED